MCRQVPLPETAYGVGGSNRRWRVNNIMMMARRHRETPLAQRRHRQRHQQGG